MLEHTHGRKGLQFRSVYHLHRIPLHSIDTRPEDADRRCGCSRSDRRRATGIMDAACAPARFMTSDFMSVAALLTVSHRLLQAPGSTISSRAHPSSTRLSDARSSRISWAATTALSRLFSGAAASRCKTWSRGLCLRSALGFGKSFRARSPDYWTFWVLGDPGRRACRRRRLLPASLARRQRCQVQATNHLARQTRSPSADPTAPSVASHCSDTTATPRRFSKPNASLHSSSRHSLPSSRSAPPPETLALCQVKLARIPNKKPPEPPKRSARVRRRHLRRALQSCQRSSKSVRQEKMRGTDGSSFWRQSQPHSVTTASPPRHLSSRRPAPTRASTFTSVRDLWDPRRRLYRRTVSLSTGAIFSHGSDLRYPESQASVKIAEKPAGLDAM